MGIRRFNPTSPGRRAGSTLIFSEEITRTSPEKSLLRPLRKTGGRNNTGRITSWHRGGGAKRAYRVIDFKRDKDGVPGKVFSIEYDPNRTANIALLHYADGEKRYILAPQGLKVGTVLLSGLGAEPSLGNALPLSAIPLGMEIHNVEFRPGRGGQIARAAGISARLVAKEGNYGTLVLPSGEMRRIALDCRATLGVIGNADHQHVSIGKAGRSRHLGIRPTVRGSAMNPIAHPMGGGEGRRNGGRHPMSPWGRLAKGGKTRKPKNPTNAFIVRGRKKR